MQSADFYMPFELTGPDGTVAVFNDEASPNYVGVTDLGVSGLDSADVRESFDLLAGGDGAVHGSFFYGRRPITLAGHIMASSVADRAAKEQKLMRATGGMRRLTPVDTSRGDCVMKWSPLNDGNLVFVRLRRQQPTRITGPWTKQFMAAMVAADPNIYSDALRGGSDNLFAAATNIVGTTNPSGAAGSTAGWAIHDVSAQFTGEALTSDTSYYYPYAAGGDLYSFKVAATNKDASATARSLGMLQTAAEGANQTVAAGQTVTVEARVKTINPTDAVGSGYTLRVNWYNDTGATTTPNPTTPTSTSAVVVDEGADWTRLAFTTPAAPAGAVRYRVGVYVESATSGEPIDFRVDKIANWVGSRPTTSYDLSFVANDIWAPSRGTFVLANAGDALAPALIRIYGGSSATTNPAIINETTGQGIFLNCTLATASDYVEIDTQQGTILLNGTTPRDSYLVSPMSRFIGLAPGNNTFRMLASSGATGSGKVVVIYRDTWL